MSRQNYIEFKCDICGKVHKVEKNLKEPKNPLKTISMPAKRYDCEGRNFSKGISNVDVCDSCFEKYWEYSQNRYSVSDCYGIKVVVKEVGGMND